jgi:ATP-dependent DNA helicase RecQ
LSANITEDIHQLLKKYWGYNAFRPLQEEIIRSVLSEDDTLALLPTGGGKSVCFQVPALALGGVTLVISPLISLMSDQVAHLRRKDIPAAMISAGMTLREMDICLNNAAYGHVRLLYVSPERLVNETFRQKLSHLPVKLIAVDEAHCISQWGYDFRPSYMRIAELREYFPDATVIALTASATSRVTDDIMEQLRFRSRKVFKTSFRRDNLRYIVQKEEDKHGRLLKIIRNIGGSGIVYVRNRRSTSDTATWLSKNGFSAGAYHAGMKHEERQKVQSDWIADRVQIICATNAFGMGIDKPSVRFVVHLDLPESLEAYFQEAGRGGRDGNVSWAVLLFTAADQQKLLDNFETSYPDIAFIRQTYQAICNYYQVAVGAGEGFSVDFDLEKVARSYGLQPLPVYNSLKFLEKEGYVSLVDRGFQPPRVMVTASKETLYEFELRNPRAEPLVKALLRSYGGMFEGYVNINESDIAYRIKNSAHFVRDLLTHMDAMALISYVPQTSLPALVFLQNRIEAKHVSFDPANYQLLKDEHMRRIRSVIAYTENGQLCRQLQLLSYFGEKEETPCGSCDVCLGKTARPDEPVREDILSKLSGGPLDIVKLSEAMHAYSNARWVPVLNEMVDEGVVIEEQGSYRLHE